MLPLYDKLKSDWNKLIHHHTPISLVLGGGGARGLAHIGVLKVMERLGLNIDLIVGTSMGAIVGACYVQQQNASRVETMFKELLSSDELDINGLYVAEENRPSENWLDHLAYHIRESLVANVAAYKRSALSREQLEKPVKMLVDDQAIESYDLKFAAVATDLIQGSEVVIDQGSIRLAVIASAALPGYLPPVEMDGRLLIDGASTSVVPIRAAKRLKPHNRIVAVDVSESGKGPVVCESAIDIVLRSYKIMAACYHQELIREADVLIQPDVKSYHWTHFDRFEEFIIEGETATRQVPVSFLK
jgi:NTE family protein